MGFTFGAPAPAAGGSAAPAAPAFSFGASATPAPAPAATGSTPAFSFGGAAPAPAAAAKPAFGAPTPAPGGAPAFSFGAHAPSGAAEKKDNAKPSAFSFGAPAPAGSGEKKDNANAPSFSFGGPAPTAAADKKEDKPTAAPLFGAAPAATATATDTKEGKKPAISFGAPAPASSASESTTTPTNASSKGGFSFGGTTPVPATPAGVATPAPVSTPAPIKTAATSAAPAAGPAPAPKEPPALEYQTLTVEEILNKFQKQLEEDSLAFCEEAKRVCEFDAVLRDSARDLGRLTNEAQRLMIEQEQVERGLEGISSLQTQLEQTLVQVEEQVDAIFQSQGHLNPLDADAERERAYEMAKGIEYRLDHVTESLRDTVLTLNQANTQTFGKASGNAIQTIGDVVTILNQHQDGLAELEAAAQKLELDCGEVHAVLATTRR